MNHATDLGTKDPAVFLLSRLAFVSVVFAYVLPVHFDYGNAPIYWLALISSLLVAGYLALHFNSFGVPEFRTTTIDLVVSVYVAWILISFFANAIRNIVAGDGDSLLAQVQSLVFLLLMIVHYLYGRFSNTLGLSVDKLIVWIAPVYLLACLAFVGFTLWTENLYLARQTTGQRDPMLIVFWAWMYCGLWITARKPWYSIIFLTGSVACFVSLTRAAYLQWGAIALLMIFAVRSTKMIRNIVVSLAVLTLATLIVWHYSVSLEGLGSVAIDRLIDLTFSDDVVVTEASASFRVQLWTRITGFLIEHPWGVAIGYGQMGPVYLPIDYIGDSGDQFRGISAHSQYFDTIVRAGLPGLIIELLVSLLVIIVPLFRRSTPIQIKIFAAALAGHLIYGIFHESIRWQVFGILFWFFAGVIAQSVQTLKNATAKRAATERIGLVLPHSFVAAKK